MPDIDLRQTVVQQPDRLLFNGLGSFWLEQFQDREVVRQLVRAQADLFLQADVNLKEGLLLSRDRRNAPVFHREVWWRVELTADDLVAEHPAVPLYNPEGPPYQPSNPFYGQGVPPLWTFALPPELRTLRCLTNRLTNATFVAYPGGGFFYRPGFVGLRQNPLEGGQFEVIETERGRAAVIWFYQTDWDFDAVSERYAVPLQSSGPTSEQQLQLVDALWSTRVRGPDRSQMYRVISGCTGVPLCLLDGETVEAVQSGDRLAVVTDQRAYLFPPSHQPVVVLGQRLREGQALTDGLDVVELSQLQTTGYPVLLPPSFFPLEAGIVHPLLFTNEEVAVVDGGLDTEGNRLVLFDIHGHPQDVERYLAYGARVGLYRAFDRRGPNAPTQPLPTDLVGTINPALLVGQHLSPRLILVVGDRRTWPAPAVYQQQLRRHLQGLVPPHGRVIIQDLQDVAEALSYSQS